VWVQDACTLFFCFLFCALHWLQKFSPFKFPELIATECCLLESNAQKSTSEHTDLPPIISGDFSTRSTAVCVHVVDKNPFRWRTTPMHRYTQQIFMYSPQQMYWYIEHTVFLKI